MGFLPTDDGQWAKLDEILGRIKKEGGCNLGDGEVRLLLEFDDWCRRKAWGYSSNRVSPTTLRETLNCALRMLGAAGNYRVGLLEFSRWASYVAARREAGSRSVEAKFLRECSDWALNHARKGLSGLAFIKALEGLVAYYGG